MKNKDFGEILRQWELEKKKQKKNIHRDLEEWLDRHPPDEKDKTAYEDDRKKLISERIRLRNMEPQRTIDLHGMKACRAEERLAAFLLQCKRDGVRKVLIIHGKGHHSRGEPVLSKTVRRFLEKNPLAGEMGYADREHGGKGALWVIIR